MGESLDETKARLTRKYLGKAGIHGMGLRRARQTICIYFAPGGGSEQDAILRQIQSEAAPFAVVPIPSERAITT